MSRIFSIQHATPSPRGIETYRYERKFHGLDLALQQVALIANLHPAHFRQAYPPRYINNIYFDTPALTNFNDHVDGAARRSKLRLRWYGSADGAAAESALELKVKRGPVGTKSTHRLGGIDCARQLDMRQLLRAVRGSGVAPALIERLASSFPTLFNRYRRHYYISADRHFRLTVDSGLVFCTVNGRHYSHQGRYEERRLIIIELKYAAPFDDFSHRVAGELPFRLAKVSKYIYGIQRLSGWEV